MFTCVLRKRPPTCVNVSEKKKNENKLIKIMGLGLSRSRHVETPRRPMPSASHPRRSLLLPRRAGTTELFETAPDFPIVPMPSYPSFNAMTGVPPMRYNNYFPSGPFYPSPQPMMMTLPGPGQMPFLGPRAGALMQPFAMSSPSPNVVPNYVSPAAPVVGPPGIPPPPSFPGRLMTDWTAGGKISPGFLGPPI